MKEGARRKYEMRARADAARATHDAIVDAMLEAVRDGWYDDIKLQDIARTAGVSVQTVLRRFGSKDGLLEAAVGQVAARLEEMAQVDAGDTSSALHKTIERYEWMGDANFRLAAQEDRIESIGEVCRTGRATHRAWLERAFAPHLPKKGRLRERRILQLLLVFDVYAWRLMRREQGASKRATEAALAELMEAVLALPKE